jgi:hypothetical protein
MEAAIVILIVALWLAGSLIPAEHPLTPHRRAFAADARDSIRVFYRICATWRLERVSLNSAALRQHFQVVRGVPHYENRKAL